MAPLAIHIIILAYARESAKDRRLRVLGALSVRHLFLARRFNIFAKHNVRRGVRGHPVDLSLEKGIFRSDKKATCLSLTTHSVHDARACIEGYTVSQESTHERDRDR